MLQSIKSHVLLDPKNGDEYRTIPELWTEITKFGQGGLKLV